MFQESEDLLHVNDKKSDEIGEGNPNIKSNNQFQGSEVGNDNGIGELAIVVSFFMFWGLNIVGTFHRGRVEFFGIFPKKGGS